MTEHYLNDHYTIRFSLSVLLDRRQLWLLLCLQQKLLFSFDFFCVKCEKKLTAYCVEQHFNFKLQNL